MIQDKLLQSLLQLVKCSCSLKKGTSIYYWLSNRKVFCLKCGEVPYRQILSSVADEEVYSGMGNPYCG
ncbi:MAG TPA: hypothetical protein DCR40_12755 [Prolixibacteraceae bacterium]|nr:hypothetical protein [Prolixibacteraceae bacterium]